MGFDPQLPNKNNEEVELLLDSLNREMIVDTYNLFFGVKDQEEDLLTLGWEIVDGGSKKTKKTKKTKNFTKKVKYNKK